MNEGKPAKANWWSRSGGESTAGRETSDSAEAGAGTDTGAGAGGDFELERPRAMRGPAEGDVGDAEGANGADDDRDGYDGDFGLPLPVGVPEAVPAVEADSRSAHDADPSDPPSDPYSTPPYGHPGPWAPAPPVRHPAAAQATPAHDTAVAEPLTPAEDPWRRYDPWAARADAPLQQNGAVPAGGRPGARKRGLVTGALVLALLSGGVGGIVGSYLERHRGDGDRVRLSQAATDESLGRAPDSVAGIAARALPSVVTLHVRGAGAEGTGTGFVLDGRGHILTNNHVVEAAGADGKVTVTFSGGETAEAEIVGRDSGYDLAVVKVSGVDGLRPVVLGNSDNVRVGDPVVAIGAPFDLANTVTSGIVSAKERPITAGGGSGDGGDVSYVDALQTDASINPGNSGGPLLDAEARVVGINSAIRSADGASGPEGAQSGSIGLGFAIPVNQGRRVAEELINTGRATHPVIGVSLDMDYGGDGARVGTKGNDGGPAVTIGGPGDRAGLAAGDVITGVDGRRVHSGEELIVRIRAHRPGDRLELSLVRGGTERTISLVLGSADGN
ncbi:trypsin-like peptidase domain-containing protein [Streptomyces sp. WI04-05B]|uniref:S1C family serine protease n=1 Tax=Streptomyces TaxID=1883 RepID=UPI0029ADB8FA|nr:MULTISPECIES: trypsin-like peptidase domain-containing protein [unclassified Streptomyces]MDX2542172.1 trypsin-like peptidase domain-containing protein [Streptomyces sp. WI04-05B]MDX2584004.1 trypsin-like peptidase domain-containing protein [Streptomyces sp. WI04-05A]